MCRQLLLNYRLKPLYFGGFYFEMTWLLEHFPRIHENGIQTPLAKKLKSLKHLVEVLLPNAR